MVNSLHGACHPAKTSCVTVVTAMRVPGQLAVPSRANSMETIGVRCSRCNSVYAVPSEKAGHRGRCPRCGGIMRVPVPAKSAGSPSKAASSFTKRSALLLIPAVVVIVALIAFLVIRKGTENDADKAPSAAELAATDNVRRVQNEVGRLHAVDRRLKEYDDLYAMERRMHAREIYGKMKAYESVSKEEYSLRAAVQLEQSDLKLNPLESDWQLETPLNVTEKTERGRHSKELESDAAEVRDMLSQMGIAVDLKPDAFGRALLNRPEVDAAIDRHRQALETKLKAAEAELQEAKGIR